MVVSDQFDEADPATVVLDAWSRRVVGYAGSRSNAD